MMQKETKKLFAKARKAMLYMLLFCSAVPLMAQEKTITGTVVDASGSTMPGVNVIVKGTTISTITNVEGKFTIKTNAGSILTFSFVGYETQEVPITDETSVLNITMKEEVKQLSEVVVIGYGVQKKSDLTGAIVSISSDQIQKAQSTTIAQAMQGRAAGVQVINNSGNPASGVSIRIRGISSINGTEPLWIVDGTPASPNSVNPSEIESMEILKDATSAAIYGANGASGVIIVTTKKGKAGKVSAELNYYYGWQQLAKKVDLANGQEYARMLQEYQTLIKKDFPVKEVSGYTYDFSKPETFPNVDYQDGIFQTAPVQNIDFVASGGGEKSTFMMSVGYLTKDGIVKGNNLEKSSIRVNSDHKITEWLKVGENIGLNKRVYTGIEEWKFFNEYNSPIVGAINFHPYVPFYDSAGNWTSCPNSTFNPIAQIELNNYQYQTYELSGNAYISLEPIKGLTYRTVLGVNINHYDDRNFSPTYFIRTDQSNKVSKISRNYSKYESWTLQNYLTYTHTFFEAFNFTGMAGFESGASKSLNFGGTRENLINETQEMWYFNASTNDTSITQLINGGGSETSGYSYLGRLMLDWKSTILFQFNYRYDGSSLFGPNHRFGSFPSYSLGWKFTEHEFVKQALPFLSFGKIRVGYGEVGNNTVPTYAYYSTIGMPGSLMYAFTNSTSQATGAAANICADKSMHWETMVTKNLGLDLSFFNNRLSTTVEIFNRYNKEMLYTVDLPLTAGFAMRDLYQENDNINPNPTTNIGKISNKGIELTIGWKDVIGKLKYSVDFNYTYVKNIAENLNNDSIMTGSTKGFRNFIITKEGQPIAEFYGYKVKGLFSSDSYDETKKVCTDQTYHITTKGDTVYAQNKAKPGDFKFEDVNNDGYINSADMVALGNPYPKHVFGLSINLEYGWFDLFAFFSGVYGNKIFNTIKFYEFNQDGTFNWSKDYVNNHYRDEMVSKDGTVTFTENHNAKYPRLDSKNENGNFSTLSNFYLEDGSYLRLQNLQLGLNIPSKYFGKLGIAGVRLYVSAQNLFTWTSYSGFDPEVNPGSQNARDRNNVLVYGVDNGSYPVPRMYSVGASVKF